MILTRSAIAQGVQSQEIRIEPYRESQLNPASYDVRLGDTLLVYERGPELVDAPCGPRRPLDSRAVNKTRKIRMGAGGFLLQPGTLYLGCTEEVIHTQRYAIIADGKSSLGRLGLWVHVTAGYVDPGFKGQVTLEFAVIEPLIIYPGMRIAQLRFQTLEGLPTQYDGNYVGETAMGPQPSRSWNQFAAKEETK